MEVAMFYANKVLSQKERKVRDADSKPTASVGCQVAQIQKKTGPVAAEYFLRFTRRL